MRAILSLILLGVLQSGSVPRDARGGNLVEHAIRVLPDFLVGKGRKTEWK
jgi:hypothetical protein